MGVPKFYRFISDRYPCINKTVKEYEIPQYDNLYLDMNSIIHTCSHPSDSDVHFRIGKKEFSDEDIFQNVCRYVQIIFSIVKPLDVMYLAFDGVAPRAKMNQQRGHRFREANKNEILKDQMLQAEQLFDANCITTGTIFMVELIDYVKHFIAYQISTNPAWQKCKIIISGSEVPGEGEHKIMQYIRYNKAQPNYNQNTRHCLYTRDADLIILGLCTHEPHFSLIRERIIFGKRMNMLTPEESDFELLHLSLLREYLEYEFTPIKLKLKFQFDLEKIIDDWVLIGFLVGNDYIPQLPNLNIVDGALPYIYQTYIKVLPFLDGYIHEYGELNVKRFQHFIDKLSEIETKVSETDSELAKFSMNESDIGKSTSEDNSEIKPFEFAKVAELSMDKNVEDRKKLIENAFKTLDLKFNREKEELLENLAISSMSIDTCESKDNVLTESSNHEVQKAIMKPCKREEYYKSKLKFDQIDGSKISTLVEEYIKAIQWTLQYYYQGCCSWSWYYPYHYAPLISDIKNLQNISFVFDMGKPFLPLQHLLAVLPPANVHLLPKTFHFLLTDQKSPIINFYPKNFEIDINGKTNDWESTVLIPFIDEDRLINAMEPYIKNLNSKERKRNTNGLICIFTYTKTALGEYPIETIFDSFVNHAQLERTTIEDFYVPNDKLIQGLCCNVSFNLSFPGFPTLKHISHSYRFEMTKSKFNAHEPTQVERMILHVPPKVASNFEDLAKEFLGKKIYAYWPYLQEAYVIGITDFNKKIILKNFWKRYSIDNIKVDECSKSIVSNLHNNTKLITEMYKDNLGIDIGETNILFHIFPIMGKRHACLNNGKIQLQTKWSASSKVFPYQLIVKEEKIQRYSLVLYKSFNDLFIDSSTCFMINQPNYGAKAEIKSLLAKEQLIEVILELPMEPDFSASRQEFFAANVSYMSSSEVAKKLKVSSTLINKITGSLIVIEEPVTSKYHNIGLGIKIRKHEKEMFGYTKKCNDVWTYSEKALQLIQNYINQFPYIFDNLNKNINSKNFAVSDLFPDGLVQLNLVKVWLLEQQIHYTTFLECYTKTLGLGGVQKLEKYVADFYSKEYKKIIITTQVPPQSLFIPGTLEGLVPPDFKADHKLLDRVICIKKNFTVPLGWKGTIIGIQEKEESWKTLYEVLFDSSFTGALTLYESSEHRCYRLTLADFINISFGQRDTQNSKPPRVDVPSKVPKNKNKSNNAIQERANHSETNNITHLIKTPHTPSSHAKELNDGNEKKSINSGIKDGSHKTNNDKTKKLTTNRPMYRSKTINSKSVMTSNVNNNIQVTESCDKKLNEQLVTKPQGKDTKNRSKQTMQIKSKGSFNKNNQYRAQGLVNQHRGVANPNKTTSSKQKNTKITKECSLSNNQQDEGTEKKLSSVKEEKKE